jgi:quercetin 2,3-dioxygenase
MSTLEASTTADPCRCEPASGATLEAFDPRPADLGGLPIRRLLPRSRRRLVGPWCFLDAFGPLSFASGKPMDVAPHPHIGLQTVSWLLEGEVLHKDSLGRTGLGEPGVLNLMTAGSGIAHSEETPETSRGRLHGVQLWLALPESHRHTPPGFEQHRTLPVLELPGARATVILGELEGARSPARAFSPAVGAELAGTPGARLPLRLDPHFEHALVLLRGEGELEGRRLSTDTLYYLGTGRRELDISWRGERPSALLLGGAPFRETVLMWWNFVARFDEEIAAARDDWEAGRRFGTVEAYRGERLAAPAFAGRHRPGR